MKPGAEVEDDAVQRARFHRWVLWNGAFAAALLLYLLWPQALLKWAIVAFIWYMLLAYSAVLLMGSDKPHTEPAPPALGYAVDIAFVACLIYLGWYLTTGAFIASILVLDAICRRDRRAARPSEP